MKRSLARWWWVASILILSAGVTALLILTRDEPQRDPPDRRGTLVEFTNVHRQPHRLTVHGHGTVLPSRTVTLVPQVRGVVVEMNPSLVPGGILQAGERLFQIERHDFETAMAQARAALHQAQAQLALEEGRQKIAEQEWGLFSDRVDMEVPDPSLALRKPQLETARAEVDAAQARLEQAEKDLERTTLRAPFNALVLEESVEPGQYVTPQSRTVTLLGTDAFWVQLAIPADRIGYVDIPGLSAEQGSQAMIMLDSGDGRVERAGNVLRLLGDLDPAGRMARLLIEVPNPLQLPGHSEDEEEAPSTPLLIDSFVEGIITGNQTKNWIEVPRKAIREGNKAYLISPTNTLEIRSLDIGWRKPDSVLIRGGLSEEDRLVTSELASPVRGMKLRTASDGSRVTGPEADGKNSANDG